uniref:Integrin_alpha2 domain-containing protein n=1 Tax=Heterorhabditis bacteriophora TaxID=37862 RepID=A0A1I7WZ37_HETBA
MCAPKYKYFFSKFEVIEPVGTCFYAEDGFTDTSEFASCKQEREEDIIHNIVTLAARHGRHRFGYGQCGFSGAVPDKIKRGNERVFIGAPGVWYWQGAIFSQNVKNNTDRPNTEYGGKEYDHDMMGLVLYTSHLRILHNLTDNISPQQGQYCGSSVAVTDLNKDGITSLILKFILKCLIDSLSFSRDDIIMGCPFFTDYVTVKDAKTQERKPQYDVGKVIVFFQTAPGVFDRTVAIVGEDQWGRFGFSLAAAGDLNQDGYNDFLVGAPYAGKNKHGAVFTMHGAKDGVRTKYTQKVEATALGSQVKTFGFSVAGGVDVDGNGMPDVAVGGWKSGNAAVLLTKPVVTVTGQTDADSVTVNVEDKNCDVDAKLGKQSCNMHSFNKYQTLVLDPNSSLRTINTCLRYEGRGDTPSDLEFFLTYNLDDHSPEPRAHFLQKDINLIIYFQRMDRDIKVSAESKTKDHPNIIERRVRLEKNKQKCIKQRFFASSTMRSVDKLSPIHWSINYTYEESRTGRLRGDKLEPAIDTTVPLTFENKINIANNCGKDNLCVPDLKITAVADRQKFLLGTKDNTMLVNVTIRNLPSTFAVIIDSNDEEEHTEEDNTVTFIIPVDFKNQLTLNGRSNPEQVDFSTRNKTRAEIFDDNEIGPVVSHLYQVSNRGPSEIDSATLDIFWPSFSAEGGHLLYIITDPVINDPSKGRCRVKQIQNINPLNLRVTNEHISTESPVSLSNHDYQRSEDYEDEEGVHEEQTSGTYQHINHPGVGGTWEPKEREPVVYEYSPDEEEEDNNDEEPGDYERQGSRVKKEARKKLKLSSSTGRAKVDGKGDKARFSDLRDAVKESKEAGGVIDYKGPLSRASVDCNSLRCTHIECDLFNLREGEYVLVEVFSRLFTNTLVDERNPGGEISSLVLARVTSTKFNWPYKPTLVTAVTTSLNAVDDEASAGGVPWWLYFLAILIGLVILALLILLLWRNIIIYTLHSCLSGLSIAVLPFSFTYLYIPSETFEEQFQVELARSASTRHQLT